MIVFNFDCHRPMGLNHRIVLSTIVSTRNSILTCRYTRPCICWAAECPGTHSGTRHSQDRLTSTAAETAGGAPRAQSVCWGAGLCRWGRELPPGEDEFSVRVVRVVHDGVINPWRVPGEPGQRVGELGPGAAEQAVGAGTYEQTPTHRGASILKAIDKESPRISKR